MGEKVYSYFVQYTANCRIASPSECSLKCDTAVSSSRTACDHANADAPCMPYANMYGTRARSYSQLFVVVVVTDTVSAFGMHIFQTKSVYGAIPSKSCL